MRAAPVEDDVDGIRGRTDRTVLDRDRAIGVGPDVCREREVGPGKAREQSVGKHGLCAADDLLGGLADEDQRAVPLVLERDQRLGRPQPPGHVRVVAAAVVDVARLAVELLLGVARIAQAGLLLHRQRIEFGAHEHRRARAVAIHRDHAGLTDMLGDGEAQLAHFAREQSGGPVLLKSQFRMRVNVLVECIEMRVVPVEDRVDALPGGGHIENRRRRAQFPCTGKHEKGGQKERSFVHTADPFGRGHRQY